MLTLSFREVPTHGRLVSRVSVATLIVDVSYCSHTNYVTLFSFSPNFYSFSVVRYFVGSYILLLGLI